MVFHQLRRLLLVKSFMAAATALLLVPLQGCIASPLQSQTIQPQTSLSAQSWEPAPMDQNDASCTAANMTSEMLTRVNRIRATGAVCGAISYPPAAPLRWSTKLQQAAAMHSNDMANHDFFNHKSATNGTTLPERLHAVGYKYQSAAENIGAGVNNVAQVLDMWVASPGHCVTLMTANFVELGASCQNSGHSHYKTYWTLKAAAPS